jgi:hypothetical protein
MSLYFDRRDLLKDRIRDTLYNFEDDINDSDEFEISQESDSDDGALAPEPESESDDNEKDKESEPESESDDGDDNEKDKESDSDDGDDNEPESESDDNEKDKESDVGIGKEPEQDKESDVGIGKEPEPESDVGIDDNNKSEKDEEGDQPGLAEGSAVDYTTDHPVLIPTNNPYETLARFLDIVKDEQLRALIFSKEITQPCITFILGEMDTVTQGIVPHPVILDIEKSVRARSVCTFDYILEIVGFLSLFNSNITMGLNHYLVKTNFETLIERFGKDDIMEILFDSMRHINRFIKEKCIHEIDVHINCIAITFAVAIYNRENEKCILGPYIEYNFENLASLEKEMQTYKNNLLVKKEKCRSCIHRLGSVKSIDGIDVVHFCNPSCMGNYDFSQSSPLPSLPRRRATE